METNDYYYLLYDLNDNLVCYFDNILDLINKFNYRVPEINRKFKKSVLGYALLQMHGHKYKLYRFLNYD